MKQIILLLGLSLTLFACHPDGRVYVKHVDLSPNIEWLKKDIKEFKVPIEDNAMTYDLSLSFRFATGYQFEVAKVKVTETSPSGKENTKEYDLLVRNEKGEYIGKPGFDIWDSEHKIESHKKYEETGIYTYTIEHIMPTDPLHYAMEIGVILDEVK